MHADRLDEIRESPVFLITMTSALHKIVGAIPQFVSPYLSEIIRVCTTMNELARKSSNKNILLKIDAFKKDLAEKINPRVLLPVIDSKFTCTSDVDMSHLPYLMDILLISIKSMSKVDANGNSAIILGIFKKSFDVRNHLQTPLVDEIENITIEAFSNLVLKLSENTFRPMYYDLFAWAISDPASRRLLSFYRLSTELARSLKSLFLLFFGHVLSNATELLEAIHPNADTTADTERQYQRDLLKSVLDCLSTSFSFDNQTFLSSKHRCEAIMKPLVNQLDAVVSDDGDDYLLFIEKHVRPALVNFAVAIDDRSTWKSLNDMILLKTKSPIEHVRISALDIIEKLWERLGEVFIDVLPETIPYLAELLEDDSSQVEKKCQQLISRIEEISGESLQKYV